MEIEELVRSLTREEFAKKIDHTLLRPDATFEDLKRACLDSAKYGFAACCISPWFVKYAREILEGTGVKVATVIAFPHGTAPMDAKVEEARIALESGAEELDMVMNVSAFKSGLYELVADEVNRVVCLAEERGALVKVIIETAYLSDEEKARAAELVAEAGAHFVKTCTGFAGAGATVHDVLLLRKVLRGRARIKASGGIRHAEDALILIAAGADRIGTSRGVRIAEEFERLKRGGEQ